MDVFSLRTLNPQFMSSWRMRLPLGLGGAQGLKALDSKSDLSSVPGSTWWKNWFWKAVLWPHKPTVAHDLHTLIEKETYRHARMSACTLDLLASFPKTNLAALLCETRIILWARNISKWDCHSFHKLINREQGWVLGFRGPKDSGSKSFPKCQVKRKSFLLSLCRLS